MNLSIYHFIALAFYVWLLVDAVKRRAPFYWFLIIMFVPLGAVIYLFVVKLANKSWVTLPAAADGPAPAPAPSLNELRARAINTPSVHNKLLLADALQEAGHYEEAMAPYRDVLARDADDKQALHGLARCLIGLGRAHEACEELAKLMELDRSFRDYTAALDYAEALWQSGEREDAIGLLEGLVSVAPRVNHRVALAHYLALSGQATHARGQLERALSEFEQSPSFVKRRDQNWAARANAMLRELG